MRKIIVWLCLCAIAASLNAQGAADAPRPLIVTWLETGGSTAIVLETPSGKVFLIDTGGTRKTTETMPDYNAGRDTISPFLKKHGHAAIDGILISHPHGDHIGGAEWLLENWKIGQLVDHGCPAGANGMPPSYLNLRKKVALKGGSYREAHAGDTLDWDESLEVETLWPPPKAFDGASDGSHSFLNNTGIVLRVRHGKNVFIFPADVYSAPKDMLKEKLKGIVLTSPHHGFHPDSNFTSLTAPKYVVVTCQADYPGNAGTPYPRSPGLYSIEKYGALGIETFVTAFDGNITAKSDGKEVTITTQRKRIIPPAPSSDLSPTGKVGKPSIAPILKESAGVSAFGKTRREANVFPVAPGKPRLLFFNANWLSAVWESKFESADAWQHGCKKDGESSYAIAYSIALSNIWAEMRSNMNAEADNHLEVVSCAMATTRF